MSSADGDTTPKIYGRDDELSRLREILTVAGQGYRQVGVVSGELGIGKTTLVSELLRTVDAYQLVGECLPVEGEAMPFAPITSSLRCLMRSLPSDASAELTQQWPRAFLDFLPFEFLDARDREVRGIEEAQPRSSGQARLFDWLLTVVCRLSTDRPLIWVIENVQWADRSTLDLIDFLARNLSAEPVVLLLTLRTDELDHDHPVRRWLVELNRLGAVTRLNLRRLTREATRAQLVDLISQTESPPHRTLTDLIYQHSEGNPLFTEELVSWANDDANQWPDTLHDLVASRLAAMPPPTRSVLNAAAVLGRTYSLDLLTEVLGRDARAVETELGPAIERHLVEPHPSADYSFAGPLIQEVLEADLRPGERRRLHEAAARAKSSHLAEASDSQFGLVAQIAHHWDIAQVERKAFAATVQAGLSAERLYALVEADRYFARAVAMACAAEADAYDELALDQLDLLLHASQAAHMVGDGSEAVALIDQAAELSDDPVRLAAVLERKGAYCFNTGRFEAAEGAYRRALSLLPGEPSTMRARVLGGLGLLAMAWSRMDQAEELCHEAIRIARVVGARQAEARALNALGVVTSYRGELDEGIRHSRQAVAIAEELDSADDMATAYIDLAHVLDLAGRFDEAVEVCRVGYAAMCRVGLARQDGSFLQANAAESLIKAGRWEEASGLLARANASQARGLRVFPILEHEATLRMRMGDFDRAEECVDQVRLLFAEFDAPDAWQREFHEVAADLLLCLRRPDEALLEARAGLALVEGGAEERMAGTLILKAMQAVAELLEAARAQRNASAVDELLLQAVALKAGAQAMHPDPVTGVGHPLPEAQAVAMTIDAEFLRCEGAESTAEAWAVVATHWEVLGQPFPVAYANWREAESLVMSKQVGHRQVAAVRRAHDRRSARGGSPRGGGRESRALGPDPARPGFGG